MIINIYFQKILEHIITYIYLFYLYLFTNFIFHLSIIWEYFPGICFPHEHDYNLFCDIWLRIYHSICKVRLHVVQASIHASPEAKECMIEPQEDTNKSSTKLSTACKFSGQSFCKHGNSAQKNDFTPNEQFWDFNHVAGKRLKCRKPNGGRISPAVEPTLKMLKHYGLSRMHSQFEAKIVAWLSTLHCLSLAGAIYLMWPNSCLGGEYMSKQRERKIRLTRVRYYIKEVGIRTL